MAWSKVLRFDDPFVYSSAVQAATPTILPTARGSSFEGMLTQVRFDRLWMQRFEVNLPLVSTGALPGNRKFFAFTYGLPSGKVRHSGIDMGGEGIVTLRDTFHLRSESSLQLATMSLPVDSFSAACETLVDREFQDTGDLIRSSPQSMLHLSRLHDAIGRLAHDIPDILQTSEVARAIEDQMTFALVRCLTVGVPDRGP